VPGVEVSAAELLVLSFRWSGFLSRSSSASSSPILLQESFPGFRLVLWHTLGTHDRMSSGFMSSIYWLSTLLTSSQTVQALVKYFFFLLVDCEYLDDMV